MSEPTLLEIDVDQEIEKILKQLNSLPDQLKAPGVLAKALNMTAETTFKSGHTAIVQRRGKGRLPVKKLLAPAVPFLYGKSYEEAEMDYYAILQKHIQRQVDRTLERRAA